MEIFEDNTPCVLPPAAPFVIAKVTGLTKTQMEKYAQAHIEPRLTERKWNLIDWNKALINENYREFLEKPIIKSGEEVIQEVEIPLGQWQKMEAEGNYYPFFEKPSVISVDITNVRVIGTIKLVNLEGNINTVITRRLYQINIDNLPPAILNKLKKDRYVEVTFNQIRTYIKNLKTGLTE